MKTVEEPSVLFTKLYFTLVSLKYFCERAKQNNKKKIEIDFVLKVIDEVIEDSEDENSEHIQV